MNKFVNAVKHAPRPTRTTNGMAALTSSGDPLTDLFYNLGASRGKDVTGIFAKAYEKNRDWALRIALWGRDIREGAGERQIFKDIVAWLEKNGHPEDAIALLRKVPDLGRWDDLLIDYTNDEVQSAAYGIIHAGMQYGDGLVFKWLPRQGETAAKLRNALGYSPKAWRKTLVNGTKVVETLMCQKEWNAINFNHVPSLAASRYKKAFARNAPEKYAEWTTALVSTDPEVKKTVKVNAAAVYPYDVIKGIGNYKVYTPAEKNQIIAQWDALPNFVGDASILPLVDVSGSMTSAIPGNPNLRIIDVAVSLGLYLADKNSSSFKDVFVTFTSRADIVHLTGNIIQKIEKMSRAQWEMSTNLHAAFENILKLATANDVPSEDMPKILLILSDMQFNACVKHDDTAMEMIARKYRNAGYEMPKVVFWNLNSSGNTPVAKDKTGAALVSGFSPSIMASVLGANLDDFSPEKIMLKTIMKERYDY